MTASTFQIFKMSKCQIPKQKVLGTHIFDCLKVACFQNNIVESDVGCSWILKVSWCLQNREELVLGDMVTSARSRNHENDEFSGFPIMNPKSY